MEKSQNPIKFSVSDFIAVVNQTFEYAYNNVEVEGEVSSFKVNQGKFVFFDLKDSTGIISCFMTVWQLRTPIEDGMKVVVSAMPKLTDKGRFSLTVKAVRPSGEGAIKKSFDILKAKLDSEGLFAPDRKRALPSEPHSIGVISSTQAAGYADFIDILDKRWGGLRIDVAHVQVQGEGAADQIIRAIEYFNEQQDLPEVVAIIRGGGSAEDLSVFNDERLVRVIAASRVPTVVGVGHETDVSLADLVADVSAITPSNAAQILVPDKSEIIRINNNRINFLLPRIEDFINQMMRDTSSTMQNILNQIEVNTDRKMSELRATRELLNQFNPKTVLRRGYSIIRGRLCVGELLNIETEKMLLIAEVKDVKEK